MARDPNQIPLADEITGTDTAAPDPPGAAWSTPIWSGQESIERLSNQLGKTDAGFRDAYLTTGETKGADGIGFRFQIPTLTGLGGIFLGWLVNSGFNGSPTGYALRYEEGTGAGGGAGDDSLQLQRWDAGVATVLDGSDFTLVVGDWLALIADTSGVQCWSSTDGSTWTSLGISVDVTLTGTLNGGLETSDGTVRFDNVYFGVAVAGIELSGTIAGTGALSGDLALALAGTIAGTGTFAGDMEFGNLAISSSIAGTSTTSGDLDLDLLLSGLIAGFGDMSGSLPSIERRAVATAGAGTEREDADVALAGAGSERS